MPWLFKLFHELLHQREIRVCECLWAVKGHSDFHVAIGNKIPIHSVMYCDMSVLIARCCFILTGSGEGGFKKKTFHCHCTFSVWRIKFKKNMVAALFISHLFLEQQFVRKPCVVPLGRMFSAWHLSHNKMVVVHHIQNPQEVCSNWISTVSRVFLCNSAARAMYC